MSKRVRTGEELVAALHIIAKNLEKDVANKVMKKLALDGYRFVVQRTPVRTGFLKSRWAISNGPVPPAMGHPGGASFVPIPPSIFPIKMGDKVKLYNNAEYASYIDQGTLNMQAQPLIQPTYEFVLGQANRVVMALSKEHAE